MIPKPVKSQTLSTHYRRGTLFFEDVNLKDLGREVGTPCYIYSGNQLRNSVRQFRSFLNPVDPRICFAVKANSNLAVLKTLMEEGVSFEVVSGGELHRLKRLQVPPDRILFSGVGKNLNELRSAVHESIFSLTVESVEELLLLAQISQDTESHVRVGLRLIPDVLAGGHPNIATGLYDHKFGIDPEHTGDCIQIFESNPQLSLVGIGCHMGSQIMETAPYFDAFFRLCELASFLKSKGYRLEYLNLGGGFGIPYRDGPEFDFEGLVEFLLKHRRPYRLIFEPGRFLVARAGILLCSVLYLKKNRNKRFVIVDAAMNDFIRPALYGAFHKIIPVVQKDASIIRADIVGPVCESSDWIGKDREIPTPEPGEMLAVLDTGAYGMVSASNYNTRTRPPEIMVDGDQYRIVRRRESLEDLLRHETSF
jgi:diaminopimelate decarboxylase